MKIEFELLDLPQRDFAELRRELIDRGLKFDETNLSAVPYSQLHLCFIGNAGAASCQPQLVQQEKSHRRERFLSMEIDEFREAETYLKIEQMYDDVMYAIANRSAPTWESLNDCQKLWLKLTCLYNHTDNPAQRMQDVLNLFLQCAENPSGRLPVDVCKVYATKMRGMASVYPGHISDEPFRDKIAEIAQTVLDFMLGTELEVIEKEQLQNFSCTSDCFKVLV